MDRKCFRTPHITDSAITQMGYCICTITGYTMTSRRTDVRINHSHAHSHNLPIIHFPIDGADPGFCLFAGGQMLHWDQQIIFFKFTIFFDIYIMG